MHKRKFPPNPQPIGKSERAHALARDWIANNRYAYKVKNGDTHG